MNSKKKLLDLGRSFLLCLNLDLTDYIELCWKSSQFNVSIYSSIAAKTRLPVKFNISMKSNVTRPVYALNSSKFMKILVILDRVCS